MVERSRRLGLKRGTAKRAFGIWLSFWQQWHSSASSGFELPVVERCILPELEDRVVPGGLAEAGWAVAVVDFRVAEAAMVEADFRAVAAIVGAVVPAAAGENAGGKA